MKKLSIICAFITAVYTCGAQTVIDNFDVGPYIVDYNGQGDIKYRLQDNIDLYDFFELQRDTTIVASVVEIPLKHAFQITGYLGANRYAAKEIGISGVWKQNVGNNLYFNGGLSLAIGHSNVAQRNKRDMLEIGIPLQIELGRLSRQRSSIFGSFGITPTGYTTLIVRTWTATGYVEASKDVWKSGFLVAPSLTFGGNILVGNTIMRIGLYATYKINCTPQDYDVYKYEAGRAFAGVRLGIIL